MCIIWRPFAVLHPETTNQPASSPSPPEHLQCVPQRKEPDRQLICAHLCLQSHCTRVRFCPHEPLPARCRREPGTRWRNVHRNAKLPFGGNENAIMFQILRKPFCQSIADEMQAPIGLHVRNNAQLFEYPFVHRQHMSAITLGGLMMVVSLFENSLLGFIGGSTLTVGCR